MSSFFKFIEGRIKSFGYAFKGLLDLLKTQPNAQVHIFAGTIAIFLGFYLQITHIEWCILLLTIGAVLSAEALNTALEYLTDLVSPDYHPLAGKAKDVAAAAVLILAFISILIGTIIFMPKLLYIAG